MSLEKSPQYPFKAELNAQPVGMVLRTEMFLASAGNQTTTPQLYSP